jgi:hypothetical protein
LLYCPFLHHILKPYEQRSTSANTAALGCLDAAIEAVRLAEVMDAQGILYEAYAFTVDLGTPGDVSVSRVGSSSRKAKVLLESLALKNCAAARCLESLMVSIIHILEN